MKEQLPVPFATVLGAALVLLNGCTTVVRENIISSVNTGLGFSLAENPKTELYEVKLGFIRSQFYSVPTGKTVEKDKNACHHEQELSNHAEATPEIVSGIKMNSDFRHLFVGASVAENFAVGKTAVMSPAAVAMYVGDAKNPDAAAKASSALTKLGAAPGAAAVEAIDGVVAFIQALPEGDYPKKRDVLETLATVGDLVPQWDFDRYAWVTVDSVMSVNDPATAGLPIGYDRFKTYRGTLQQSINVLKRATGNPNIRSLHITAAAAPISDAQIVKAGSDLESQKSRLKTLDRQFAEHPAIIKLLDYFTSIAKP